MPHWRASGCPLQPIQFIDSPDRALVHELLQMYNYIDIIIPRGGAGLHRFCRENSRIPVITGGSGICHLFGDESADVSVDYRPSWMRYRAELNGFIEHGFGTRVWWALSPELDVSGSADALVGRDPGQKCRKWADRSCRAWVRSGQVQ